MSSVITHHYHGGYFVLVPFIYWNIYYCFSLIIIYKGRDSSECTLGINQYLAKKMAKKGKFIWNQETTLLLIELYQNHSVLYLSSDPNYKNKVKRLEALQSISNEIIEKSAFAASQCLSVEDIKQKIRILRTQYLKELSKIRDQENSGMGTNESYIPKLWCFDYLAFLKDCNIVTQSVSNLEVSCFFIIMHKRVIVFYLG